MYYGHYNEEGKYIGFYNKEINGENIPIPNVELSEEEWQLAITGEYAVVEGKNTFIGKKLPSDEELLNSIRAKRNLLLKESDWTQLIDSPLSDAKKIEWSDYRKKLRDMIENCEINDPVFPDNPN